MIKKLIIIVSFLILIITKGYAHSPYGDGGEPLTVYDMTAAPTVNDDIADGYTPGSIWIDVTNDTAYVCLDSTAGAAVWEVSGSIDQNHAASHEDGGIDEITGDLPQFIRTDGTRPFIGSQSLGDNNITSVNELHFHDSNSTPQVYFKKVDLNTLELYVGGALITTWAKTSDFFLLQENGAFLLQENGGKLIIE